MGTAKLLLVVISICGTLFSGCISSKSYIDPTAPILSYNDMKRSNEPLKLKVDVQFQRNGAPFPSADTTLKDNSERILRSTGIIMPMPEAVDGEIFIVCNNLADLSSAGAKGFGTGLTFGAVGSTVTDAYELSVTVKKKDGKVCSKNQIRHAFHTAIGNTSIPAGVEPVQPDVAFVRVLEQMLLRAVKEMQESGDLALKSFKDRVVASWVEAYGRMLYMQPANAMIL